MVSISLRKCLVMPPSLKYFAILNLLKMKLIPSLTILISEFFDWDNKTLYFKMSPSCASY